MVLIAVVGSGCAASPGPCSESPGFYEREKYAVTAVRLIGPLAHFGAIRATVMDAIPQKVRTKGRDGAVSEAGTFDTQAWSLGTLAISNRFRGSPGVFRVAFAGVVAGLEACDEQEKTLTATYTVLAFQIPAAIRFSGPADTALVARALGAAGLQKVLGKTFPMPAVGFDPARGFFGGGQVEQQAAPGGLFDAVQARALVSGNSLDAGLDLRGARSREKGLFRDQDWSVFYRYLDQPAKTAGGEAPALGQRTFGARFGSSTKPLAGGALVLRFGGSVSGGSSSLQSSRPLSLRDISFANAKAYAGLTAFQGPYTGRFSYGVQRTQQGRAFGDGFFKHVIDTRQEFQFPLRDHRPLVISLDAGAGWLPSRRGIPAGEAFFGGGFVRPFVENDPWEIRNDPYFRAAPQLSLQTGQTLGATRFVSLATTAAVTVWAKPLLPKEVAEAGVMKALRGQLASAVTSVSDDYVRRDPQLQVLRAQTLALEPVAGRLQAQLDALAARGGDELSEAVTKVADALAELVGTLEDLKEPPGNAPTVPFRTILLGFGGTTPATLAVITGGIDELVARTELTADEKAALGREKAEFLRVLSSGSALLEKIDADALLGAGRDLAFAERLVDRLEHQVNLFAISPVALLDVTKLWGPAGQSGPVRVGVGPGIRFSMVNVHFTIGYGANTRRQPGDRAGALFFQLNVSDLFR